ncbi:MAG: LysM peptidoglycan-binding domain-containing protein [Balneolaceae bacterium]|nr:LysM peptidoglycan-binding domain-containing protein [Balneolaceae bacterium]
MISLNKLFVSLIFILIPIISFAPESNAQQAEQEHIVQQGETLFSISREYDIAVSDLREWNQLETDNLQTGQVLSLTPPSNDGRIVHTVEPGESLFGISRRYDVTIAEIQQWNNLDGTGVDAGTELVIYRHDAEQQEEPLPATDEVPETAEADQPQTPTVSELEQMDDQERTSIVRQATGTTSGSDTYTVRSGDTLYQVARDHDMTVNELRDMNNIQGDAIRVGQRLTVRRVRTAPSVAEGAEDSTPQGKFALYRIQSGENVQTLLERFRMSMRELEALNPGSNVASASSGQQLTVLLPPTRSFSNPFKRDSNLENLGTVPVSRYSDSDRASPTTSGELYNPNELTAAHANMSIGNVVYIENPSNGNGVYVRVNDRYSGDGLRISRKAYEMLGFSNIEQPQVTIYLDN